MAVVESITLRRQQVQKKFFGSTGTEVHGGRFQEDHLPELTAEELYDTYNQMRRGDAQVRKVLTAMKNPLKSATYSHQFGSDEDDLQKEIAEYLDEMWFENPLVNFGQFLNESLTFLEFGHSLHEFALTVVEHPNFGLLHTLGSVEFRKQRSIFRWIVKPQLGLVGIEQVASGDSASNDKQQVFIPKDRLLITVNEQEGDNWEGLSILRACYGPWLRKDTFLKLIAVGVEKAAIGTPIGKFPQAIENEDDKQRFADTVANLAVNEQNYVVMPQGYEIDIFKADFDARKMHDAVQYEDKQMSGSALVSFLELGQSGGGAYALGTDLSDFFLASLQHVGNQICQRMHEVNCRVVEANWGAGVKVPKAICSKISKDAGKELAETIKSYIDSGVIRPDDQLEAFAREANNLPKAEVTRAEDPEASGDPPSNDGEPDGDPPETIEPVSEDTGESTVESVVDQDEAPRDFNLEDPFRDLTDFERSVDLEATAGDFETQTNRLQKLMRNKLSGIVTFTMRDFQNRLKNRGEKPRARVGLDTRLNVQGYERDLQKAMAAIVNVGVAGAKRDLLAKVPDADFEDEKKKAFEFLPAHVQAALLTQARQQARTHAEKIESIIAFGVVAGEDANLTDPQMNRQLEKSLDDFVQSKAISDAARTVTSQNINRGRDGFFFKKENLENVQAFQYSAILDGGTTDICLSLDGQIFKGTDNSLTRLRPPNHHGCRSIIIPIGKNEDLDASRVVTLKPRTDNPSLVQQKKKQGKPVPSLGKIEKSRNL